MKADKGFGVCDTQPQNTGKDQMCSLSGSAAKLSFGLIQSIEKTIECGGGHVVRMIMPRPPGKVGMKSGSVA